MVEGEIDLSSSSEAGNIKVSQRRWELSTVADGLIEERGKCAGNDFPTGNCASYVHSSSDTSVTWMGGLVVGGGSGSGSFSSRCLTKGGMLLLSMSAAWRISISDIWLYLAT